ncbi:hypothetical protein J2125_000210 [Erwinia toletana]|uniref:Peptidoglycan-binding domain-containing protein n=1 Tax=Winslowiella toletana TaxID=92490 RepID=A0ABS4P2Y5_9GAMM|nr:hypothetical protein [Winslowiella toletana]MBP2167018.1 hypothetical protein [Winslowiella toletana]
MRQLSGAPWVQQFQGSTSSQTLSYPFRTYVEQFLSALKQAGAKVTISATLRPPERAYLMHWSWKISRRLVRPSEVPVMAGVNIEWDHKNDAKSLQAANAMVAAYGMTGLHVAPALRSRHTEGKAIDMNISWSGDLNIIDKSNNSVIIKSSPRDGMNTDLHQVGRSYGVIKFHAGAKDKPHWSSDGR